jgi:CRISPR/Cas system-associated exonuclease Cas4 (RecB family)
MSLSKSQYIRGLQCEKALWLHKHRPDLRKISQQSDMTMTTGTSVGELARNLFPDGESIEFDSKDFQGMGQKTKELIEQGVHTIYEASFSHDGIFVMCDILHKDGDEWQMIEVKSATNVKEYYLNDIAMQWYTLSRCNVPLSSACVAVIDNSYVRKGDIEVDKLFKIIDVTLDIQSRQEDVISNLMRLTPIIEGEMPKVLIGPQCNDPFGCDYIDHCWSDVPSVSVFDLYRLNSKKKFEAWHEGVSIDDADEKMSLTTIQRLQVEAYRDKQIRVDSKKIEQFLERLVYPLAYFDFETFMDAIPRFDTQRPYQQMPFQYSLHIEQLNGDLEHKEFLADEHYDPRRALAEKMLEDIPEAGSIIAFNQSFEITRIKELAEMFIDLREPLLALIPRFIDLIDPFRSLAYYHPDFNGSFSIKSVLPAMFPDNNDLSYKKLGIQNGGMAMETYAALLYMAPELRAQKRQELLDYCHLDTLAMVKILEKLKGMI